jgi:CBS-domain-containing membrane protein
LAVVDDDGRMVGVVPRATLLAALAGSGQSESARGESAESEMAHA